MILPAPPESTSHAQPEPNCVRPACTKSALNLSQPPRPAIKSATGPAGGAPPPLGFMLSQKNVWFQTWAALLNSGPELDLMISTRLLDSSGLPAINPLR